jgi:VCBS repeat-containing protein
VLGHEIDDDGPEPLTAHLETDVQHGMLDLYDDGSFDYTPDQDWHGEDTFTYRAYDGEDYSNVATVTITVNSVNDPPVSSDNTVSTNEDQDYVFQVADFPFSDVDVGDSLSHVKITSLESVGDLTWDGNPVQVDDEIPVADITAGLLVFTPQPDDFGIPYDSFEFEVKDGYEYSVLAYTMTIDVISDNDPPVADDDFYSTDEDTPLNVVAPGVLGNDSDFDGPSALTASLVGDVSHGVLDLYSDGSFDYVPSGDWFGIDSFTYQAFDGEDYSNTAVVTITVNSVNDPPLVNDDTYGTSEDTQLNVPAPGVLDNDMDSDGPQVLTASLVNDVSNGTLNLYSDGSFNYTTDLECHGVDSFAYQKLFTNLEMFSVILFCLKYISNILCKTK